MSSLTFSLVQTALAWENKAANLAMFKEKIESITAKTEIVLLPEMFSTGFSMQPSALAETMEGETVKWMKEMARSRKVVLAGTAIIESDGNYYNRLLWVLPDQTIGYYDKRHRFAFAGEDEKYTAGNKRLIAQVKGWKINLQICYDLRFPVWARQQPPVENNGYPEYDVLVYLANWPERRSHAWKSLLIARAIENQCYVIGVNRTGDDGHGICHSGDSMVVDPLGEVLYHKANEEAIHTITLDKEKLDEMRTRFPFWRDADHFHINQH